MALFSSRRFTAVLTTWLAIGVAWLLLGMFLLPTSKLYQHGLHIFLMLPGLVTLLTIRQVRQAWDWLLLSLAVLSLLWAGLSILWGGDPGELKKALYIGLTANAFVALAALNARLFWQVLGCCALLGGWFAWFALFDFYVVQGRSLALRAVGFGLLNQTILASHVIGVLGVTLLFMREWLPQRLHGWPRWMGLLGCLSFLLMSRSKGPLLALLACLVLSYAWVPSRRVLVLGVCSLIAAILGAWLLPEQLLRGGLSFRPQLLQVAWGQFLLNPLLGLGVGVDYLLAVPVAGKSYEHAHNLYMHIAVQLGAVGLLFWLALQGAVAFRAWSARSLVAGQALCAILVFSMVALLTDGIGPWIKPREEWFTVWLPVFVCLALMASRRALSVPESEVLS